MMADGKLAHSGSSDIGAGGTSESRHTQQRQQQNLRRRSGSAPWRCFRAFWRTHYTGLIAPGDFPAMRSRRLAFALSPLLGLLAGTVSLPAAAAVGGAAGIAVAGLSAVMALVVSIAVFAVTRDADNPTAAPADTLVATLLACGALQLVSFPEVASSLTLASTALLALAIDTPRAPWLLLAALVVLGGLGEYNTAAAFSCGRLFELTVPRDRDVPVWAIIVARAQLLAAFAIALAISHVARTEANRLHAVVHRAASLADGVAAQLAALDCAAARRAITDDDTSSPPTAATTSAAAPAGREPEFDYIAAALAVAIDAMAHACAHLPNWVKSHGLGLTGRSTRPPRLEASSTPPSGSSPPRSREHPQQQHQLQRASTGATQPLPLAAQPATVPEQAAASAVVVDATVASEYPGWSDDDDDDGGAARANAAPPLNAHVSGGGRSANPNPLIDFTAHPNAPPQAAEPQAAGLPAAASASQMIVVQQPSSTHQHQQQQRTAPPSQRRGSSARRSFLDSTAPERSASRGSSAPGYLQGSILDAAFAATFARATVAFAKLEFRLPTVAQLVNAAEPGEVSGTQALDAAADAANAFVSRVFELAERYTAEVHSFVGDEVILSWGAAAATSGSVERRAARFLSELRSLPRGPRAVEVCGAVCSGPATVLLAGTREHQVLTVSLGLSFLVQQLVAHARATKAILCDVGIYDRAFKVVRIRGAGVLFNNDATNVNSDLATRHFHPLSFGGNGGSSNPASFSATPRTANGTNSTSASAVASHPPPRASPAVVQSTPPATSPLVPPQAGVVSSGSPAASLDNPEPFFEVLGSLTPSTDEDELLSRAAEALLGGDHETAIHRVNAWVVATRGAPPTVRTPAARNFVHSVLPSVQL